MYLVEDRAFAAMGYGKPLEVQLDHLMSVLAASLVMEVSAVVSVAMSHSRYWWIPLVGVPIGAGLVRLVDHRAPDRLWR